MSLATQLADLIGLENVRSDAISLEAYSHDATPLFHGLPEVIVTPRSTEQVSQVVRYAADTGTPIIPRGAGSNLCAATVALNGGIVLIMVNMNKVLEISPS